MTHIESKRRAFSQAISSPAIGRAPFFDGMHEERAAFALNCQCCGLEEVVNVLTFISQADAWYRALPTVAQDQILQFFDCRHAEWRSHPIIESHDDGQPHFGLVACSACQRKHLLYLSFYERQPARYVATLQGAARVEV